MNLNSSIANTLICMSLIGCGSSESSSSSSQVITSGTLEISATEGDPISLSAQNQEQVSLAELDLDVNFNGQIQVDTSGLANLLNCSTITQTDDPPTEAGLDCDQDGGVAAYQTPTKYVIAFKTLSLIMAEGDPVDVISFDSLSSIHQGGIFTFTEESSIASISLDPLAIRSSITAIKTEIYYYELSLNIYGQAETIRIYLSDDDFASEGSKGHHQGDITYFDDNGTEHWAYGGDNWFASPNLTSARGEYANGDGGTDAETGHARGMFGNTDFWDTSSLKQGSEQDIYTETFTISNSGLKYTLEFDISDTWYYEDFDSSNADSFDPCINSSQEACGGEWSPIFPSISTEAEESAIDESELVIELEKQHHTIAAGELWELEAILTGATETVSLPVPTDIPTGLSYTVSDSAVAISWTPKEGDVSTDPYLIPIIAQDEDGSGVVRTVAVMVE